MKKTIIKINDKIEIGGRNFIIIAGPCAAESEEQTIAGAKGVLESGAHIFRTSFFKPRTLPHTFQGCGPIGFAWLKKSQAITKIPSAIEVRTSGHIDLAIKNKIDILWIGARNSQNFDLLIEIGKKTAERGIPVILKRGSAMKLKEWLGAAEYIRTNGNPNVILCERGVVGFDSETTRNMLDLQTAVVAQKESGLPVIVDPSHASGRKDLIMPMCLAAKAAGLDGVLVEAHPSPETALTDKDQQISINELKKIIKELNKIPF